MAKTNAERQRAFRARQKERLADLERIAEGRGKGKVLGRSDLAEALREQTRELMSAKTRIAEKDAEIERLERQLRNAAMDTIRTADLADWLRESGEWVTPEYLKGKVKGYMRFVARRGKVCISCGAESTARMK